MFRFKRDTYGLESPAHPSNHPLEITERAGAATHLISSLEYIVRKKDRQPGGLNHWETMRKGFPDSLQMFMPIYDFFAVETRVKALHISRAIASTVLIISSKQSSLLSNNKFRCALNAYLAITQFAVYPRHFYGTDGSDQVAFLIQSGSALGRASHPIRGRNHAAAFIALQTSISYCAAGLAKLPGQKWQSGEALPLIMQTQTYGDAWFYKFLRQHPLISRAMCHGVLAFETLFPLFFLQKGKYIDLGLIFMALFHLANARFMGLSRFAVAFIGTYPCVRALAKGVITSE